MGYIDGVCSLRVTVILSIDCFQRQRIAFVNTHGSELLSLTVSRQQTVDIQRTGTVIDVEITKLIILGCVFTIHHDILYNTSQHTGVLDVLQLQELVYRLGTKINRRSGSIDNLAGTSGCELRRRAIFGQVTRYFYIIAYIRNSRCISRTTVCFQHFAAILGICHPEGDVSI